MGYLGLVDFEALNEPLEFIDVLFAVQGAVGIVPQAVEPVPIDKAVHVGLKLSAVFVVIGENEFERLMLIDTGNLVFQQAEVAHRLIIGHLLQEHRRYVPGRHPSCQGLHGMGKRLVHGALLHEDVLGIGTVFGQDVEFGCVDLVPFLRCLGGEVLRG